jgi:hypothetical protein
MNYRTREHVDLHVIDAIDEAAFASGASDAAMLNENLRDTSINIVSHVARDVEALCKIIDDIGNHRRSYVDPRKAIPYVHISCHGTVDDLCLGHSVRLSWSELSALLLPLQEKTDYNVPLSLSSCYGYHGAKLAYEIAPKYRKRRPYHSLVGPRKEEYIIPLCAAFGRFYRYLLVDFKPLGETVALVRDETAITLDFTFGSCVADPTSEWRRSG